MSKITGAICWILVFLFPAAMFAADVNPAMLSGNGVVTVNGALIKQASAVYAGDVIATQKDGSVTVTTNGSLILLPENTAAVYGGSDVRIENGRVQVKTSNGMQGRLGNVTVTPVDGRARYQMNAGQGRLILAAIEGPLKVSNGTDTLVLPAGQMMVYGDDSQEPAPPPPGRGGQREEGGTWYGWKIVALAAIAALIAWIIVDETGGGPASPSRP